MIYFYDLYTEKLRQIDKRPVAVVQRGNGALAQWYRKVHGAEIKGALVHSPLVQLCQGIGMQ